RDPARSSPRVVTVRSALPPWNRATPRAAGRTPAREPAGNRTRSRPGQCGRSRARAHPRAQTSNHQVSGSSRTYGYDNADRVTAACYGTTISSCPSGSLITYSYDKVGNRLTQDKFGTTTYYSYDPNNQICWEGTTSGSSCGTVPSGDTAYTYDNDGQQTAEGLTAYTYDLAGELTQAANGSTTLASFTYDGDSNRLTKTAGSTTTNYYWDENNDLPQLALEAQGGTSLRDYEYGNELLSMQSGGATYYFHHDALESTAAVTNGSGSTEWTYTYDPYGNARATTKVDPSAPVNPILFTGQLQDTETGLYDLRARDYNPADGDFLSTDPLAERDTAAAFSVYEYASDEPLLYIDPSGQVAVDQNAGGGGGAHPCPNGGAWYRNPDECPPPATPHPASGGSLLDSVVHFGRHVARTVESGANYVVHGSIGVLTTAGQMTIDVVAVVPYAEYYLSYEAAKAMLAAAARQGPVQLLLAHILVAVLFVPSEVSGLLGDAAIDKLNGEGVGDEGVKHGSIDPLHRWLPPWLDFKTTLPGIHRDGQIDIKW
ncbi:MAG: RHS repeat domain-containing protein, partial [Terriglobales bacterium]